MITNLSIFKSDIDFAFAMAMNTLDNAFPNDFSVSIEEEEAMSIYREKFSILIEAIYYFAESVYESDFLATIEESLTHIYAGNDIYIDGIFKRDHWNKKDISIMKILAVLRIYFFIRLLFLYNQLGKKLSCKA